MAAPSDRRLAHQTGDRDGPDTHDSCMSPVRTPDDTQAGTPATGVATALASAHDRFLDMPV